MRLLQYVAAIGLLYWRAAADPDPKSDKDEEDVKPCTVRSPHTGSYFDLTPIMVLPVDPLKKPNPDVKTTSWHARGYDYGANFTLNFCGPVIETLGEVEGVGRDLAANVSAYYTMDDRVYSIGHNNDTLVIRGRKMILTYTNGSPCDSESSVNNSDTSVRRKSTLISLLCDRDPMSPKASPAFVGASPDECTYFFEVRTAAACPVANVDQSQIGPSGVFGVIATIAVLVYLAGGVMYQRAVLNQRGWRQLPNYSLWSGIGNFMNDIFVICFASCRRCMPRRRGYNRVSANGRVGSGLLNHSDDENRIIDSLDEDWDDY